MSIEIVIPAALPVSDDLWNDPTPQQAKPKKTRKAKAGQKEVMSLVNQYTTSIAQAHGINLFSYVVHPVTLQRGLFYAVSNDLQNFYKWSFSRINQWILHEKHTFNKES